MEKNVNDFWTICNNTRHDLHDYCIGWLKKIEFQHALVKNTVSCSCTESKVHVKRVIDPISATVFLTAGLVTLIVSSGVAYGLYKIDQIENRLNANEKINKDSMLDMINTTRMELERHQKYINKLVDDLNVGSTQNTISSYALSIITLLNLVKQRNDDILKIKPTHNLLNEVQKQINGEMYIMPNMEYLEEILQTNSKKLYCSGGTVMIKVRIPLILKEVYFMYTIITVPYANNNIIYLDNQKKLVTNIITNRKNTSYINIETKMVSTEHIYEVNEFKVIPACMQQILYGLETVDCALYKKDGIIEALYPLQDNFTIVFSDHVPTLIICPDMAIQKHFDYGIVENHEACSISTPHYQVNPKFSITLNNEYKSLSDLESYIPEIVYSPLKPNLETWQEMEKRTEARYGSIVTVESKWILIVSLILITFIVIGLLRCVTKRCTTNGACHSSNCKAESSNCCGGSKH